MVLYGDPKWSSAPGDHTVLDGQQASKWSCTALNGAERRVAPHIVQVTLVHRQQLLLLIIRLGLLVARALLAVAALLELDASYYICL